MKKLYSIFILAVSLLITSSAWSQGSVTATYTGDISTDRSFTSIPGTSSCPGLLDVVIPAGNMVASVDVLYNMTAGGGAWMSEQKSWLYCSTTTFGEAAISSGSGSSGGTVNYSRTGLTIADGASGTVSFEMHAGRSWGGSGCSTTYNKVDDGTWTITVNYIPIPSCVNPTSFAASGATATTVDLDWTAGDSETLWDLELVDVTASGSATGTPTTEDVTTNPYTLSGLTAQNDYQVYLRADCSGDNSDTSDWIGPVSFTTLCAALTTPITENFETFTTSASAFTSENCWSAVGGSYFWKMAPGTDTSSGSTGPSPTVTSGNYFFTEASSGSTGDTASLSVQVDLSGLTTPYLSFDYHMYGATIGSLEVLIDTNIVLTLTGQQQTSDTSPFLNTGVVLSAYTGQSVTVTLRGTKGSSFTGDIAIDNFVINEAPSCPGPSNLAASGETATTVDLDWTAGSSETLWDIELVDVTASGSATGTPTTEDVTTNPYTLSGLTSNNDYQVYLRADCSGDNSETSDWVGPVSFTTPCSEISTFPSTTDFTLNPPTDCWSQAGDGTPSEGPTGTSSSWNAGLSFNGVPSNRVNLYYTGKEEWLISPTYAIPTGDAHELILTLAVTDYNSTSADANGMAGTDDEVQLLQTLDGGTTWTNLETWDSTNEPAYTGTAYTIDLTSLAGSSVQFALWATEGTADDAPDYDFHVGGFTVRETPSCLDVTGVAVGNIVADTAEVSWTDSNPTPAGLYQYELVDVTAGDVVLTTDTTASSPLSLTGLTTLNEYKIRVRANCGSVLSASYSAWSSYVSWTHVELPGCPTNLTPIDGTTDQDWRSVTLSWDAATTGGAATSYSVLYGTTEAGMFEVATTTDTSFTLNGLNSGATVFIGVNAVNATGTSASCTANSITTNTDGLSCATPIEVFEGTNTQDIHQYIGSNEFSYYSYTTTTGGTLDIGSCNGGVDTTLYILEPGCATQLYYAGDTCATGTGTNYASNVSFEVNPNVEYIIAWYSNWSISNFDFDITLTPTCSGTTTTWDGTAWSNGAPDANSYAIMSGAYSTGTDGAITACVMQADADVTIDGATDAAISEVLVMAGNTLTIDEDSSLSVSGDFTNSRYGYSKLYCR